MLERILETMDQDSRVFGKFEGIVTDDRDPLFGGRLEVLVPHVLGTNNIWAMPCVPYADDECGLFMLPPVGTGVWVEFLEGNIDRPIWSGCFWKDGKVPSQNHQERMIVTPEARIVFNSQDPKGELVLENKQGLTIILDGSQITIKAKDGASVELKGRKTSVNGTALEVE